MFQKRRKALSNSESDKKEKYSMVSDIITINNSIQTTYGIRCEIEVIRDISTDCECVNKLVKALNDNDVSYIHLHDIIEDFLN